ncbi:MAG: hypothetical protein U9N54_00530 [candidate division Zixibacteria bacterium]|nr:hypothetical protein [candidate division Zixibacteria bacterium]
MNFKKNIILIILVFSFILLNFSNLFALSAPEYLRDYFSLLESGNFESAKYYWRPGSLERAERFGITFDNIPVKADCSSPIVRDLEVLKYHLTRPIKSSERLEDNSHYRLEFFAILGSEEITHYYYTTNENDYVWLVYPQDYFCKDWTIKESKYFRIHVQPGQENYLHETILTEADKFINKLCKSFDFSDEKIAYIEKNKIEYFYCASDRKVEEITGFLVKGTFDLASNDIISSFFPHYNQVAHLLINYKFGNIPLYTLPLLREGTSVYYAGRAGKAPYPLLELGGYILHHEVVELDSILTMSGFEEHAASDIAYPISGLFVSYLIDKIGQDEFFLLYKKLSGPFDKINGLNVETIQTMLAQTLNKSAWSEVLLGFNEFIEKNLVDEAEILPGKIKKGNKLFENDFFTITENKNWIGFECKAQKEGDVTGNILFQHQNNLDSISSALFEEQYSRRQLFEGFRFGVRYDQNEAGLYDYGTNHLLAKYIWGISPSDKYFDKEKRVVNIKMKKILFPDGIPKKNNFKLLPD